MLFHWYQPHQSDQWTSRVECTPTEPKTKEKILSPRNEIYFTNGINIIPLEPIVPMNK